MRMRVSSPRAAKIAAGSPPLTLLFLLAISCHELLEHFSHNLPAAFVRFKCLGAALQRNLIEATFRYREHHSFRLLLQCKRNESRRLLRVVHLGIDRIGVPTE